MHADSKAKMKQNSFTMAISHFIHIDEDRFPEDLAGSRKSSPSDFNILKTDI